jgi:poly-gamma-glutamate synthesis protein (capsule biosynthesis protein)
VRQQTDDVENQVDTPVVRRAVLLFGGDVMMHRPQVVAAAAEWAERTGQTGGHDFTETFRHLRPIVDTADVVVVNLETTLRKSPPYTGYPMFGAPTALAGSLRLAGVDIAVTANNHILDKGLSGVEQTIAALDSVGVRHTGVAVESNGVRNPLCFSANSLRFALFSYTYGTNGMPLPEGVRVNMIDTVAMAADLAHVGEDTDLIIMYLHWGDEYSTTPNRAQREVAEWCARNGVGLVVGSHPHVVQPIEYLVDSTCVVAWSLGNLVSNQRWRRSDGGLLLSVAVTRRDSLPLRVEAVPVPVWVHNPLRGGVRRYIVLPEAVADTMLIADPAAKRNYDLFISDTRKLLNIN